MWAPTFAEEPTSRVGIVSEQPVSGRFVKIMGGYMVPYTARIPGTDITYTMTPIPGGVYLMGSPDDELHHQDDEGPQVKIEVAPFWMGSCEVTWAEYKTYMALTDHFREFAYRKIRPITKENAADAVTSPSIIYDRSINFESGDNPKQPAVSMSQFSAKQYTKWLSLTNRRFYRLPTEAEWEYAARAGTTTAYSFGDDADKLDDFAWHVGNSNGRTQPVGKKKPNAWGLYDMHGNAAEWVIDAYSKDYKKLAGKTTEAKDAIQWPTKLFPRVVRGGSFNQFGDRLRSASRVASHDDNWREEDPQLPLSPWWYTSEYGLQVGFRIVRPLHAPSRKEREKYWQADHPALKDALKTKYEDSGRGGRGIASPDLPAAIQKLGED